MRLHVYMCICMNVCALYVRAYVRMHMRWELGVGGGGWGVGVECTGGLVITFKYSLLMAQISGQTVAAFLN